ncbi:helix-turn-helix domain-containing protein [Chitinophaga vietnamensis]|uniref:helix-turn-helix domain-containing protein n=1 Tax=Chitinophaga vietnamensis TaxID=2593957 RepID=UPI00117826A3|nr:helix-turn-helix domain-containing protein [Chitinophaga vietnamensis]
MQTGYKIYIKGMVCDRCIIAVRDVFSHLHIPVTEVHLGAVTTITTLTPAHLEQVQEQLSRLGFSLLEDKRIQLVRRVKALVADVYAGNYDFPEDFRFSDLVLKKMHQDYKRVSSIFSAVEGITLEKYIIAFRIEKVKEMLVYSDASLSDIAFRLNYSSAQHLSGQFKSQTGLNPSYYKEIKASKDALRHHD